MKTYVQLWSYLAEFLVEWETFQTKVVKNRTHFISNNFLFKKSSRLWDNVEKYGTVR
jgi:hypothetical protein